MNTKKNAIRLLAEICRQKGIRKVVFSPGSRSAPMVFAFSQIPEIECLVIPDERVAGYFALGLAQQLKQTVAVVCTSGTAALNLGPAVCEAFYQHVPLLLLTADRPEGAVNKGENQAIWQDDIFADHIVLNDTIDGDASSEEELAQFAYDVNEAIDEIANDFPGPVHLNVRLSEPLYEFNDEAFEHHLIFEKSQLESDYISLKDLQRIKKTFSRYARKLIIVGRREPDKNFRNLLKKLNARTDVVVIHETLSNVHLENTIGNIDASLAAMKKEEEERFIPDVVITLGHQIISKKLKQFLQNKPKVHWDVPPDSNMERGFALFGNMIDSFEPINENQFLETLLHTPDSTENNFKTNWLALSHQASQLSEKYFAQIPFSDLQAIKTLVETFPAKANIQYGNSTPVRYGSFFEHKKSSRVHANRGTSGIDGCLSTAAGAAYTNKEITVCVLGDVSFFYDSNALWNNYLSPQLRIILINNAGGTIFRLIDGPGKVQDFEKFFETKHNLSAKHLASMYDLPYYFCALQNELEETLKTFYEPSATAKILEIKTDGAVSAEVYRQYFEYLRNDKQ